MPNCAICKKSVTTGIVLCGHCAKGLAALDGPRVVHRPVIRGDRAEPCYLRLCHVRGADLRQPGQRHDLPQRYQGVAAEAGGAILPRKGGVMEGHDERKHLIQALDRVSLF